MVVLKSYHFAPLQITAAVVTSYLQTLHGIPMTTQFHGEKVTPYMLLSAQYLTPPVCICPN